MYQLIHLGTGEVLCPVSSEDFSIVSNNLMRASDAAAGYYLNAESLALLGEAELSDEVLQKLTGVMRPAGLDIAWEKCREANVVVYSGWLVDDEGVPLGGIRATLVSPGHKVVGWSYSRPDGAYSVSCPKTGEQPRFMRFSGRGDLVLDEFVIETDGEQGESVIDTLTGVVVTSDGAPVSNICVQLVEWKSEDESSYRGEGSLGGSLSWGDTDEEGRFAVPVRISRQEKPWNGVLELIAPTGETLRKLVVSVRPNVTLELGEIQSPAPSLEWGGEPVTQRRSVVMYPGVSERPLS